MRLFIFRKFLVLFLLFSLVITGFPAFSGNFVKAENLPLENIPEDSGGEVSPMNLPELPVLPLEPLPNPGKSLESPPSEPSLKEEVPESQPAPQSEDLPVEPMGDKTTKLPLEAEDKANLEGLNERLEQSPPPPRKSAYERPCNALYMG